MKNLKQHPLHILYIIPFLVTAITYMANQEKSTPTNLAKNNNELINTQLHKINSTLKYAYTVTYQFDSMYQSNSEKESQIMEYTGEITQLENGDDFLYKNHTLNTNNQNIIDNHPVFMFKNKTDLHLHKDEGVFTGEIKRLLATALQFTHPTSSSNEWKVNESLGIGEILAKYQRQEDGSIIKTILDFKTNEIIISDSALLNMTTPHITSWYILRNDTIEKSFYKIEQKKKSKNTDITFDLTTTVKLEIIKPYELQTNINFSHYVGLPIYVHRDYFEDEPTTKPLQRLEIDTLLEKLSYLSTNTDDDVFWSIRDDLIHHVEINEEFGRQIVTLASESASDVFQAHLIGLLGQTSNNEGQKRLVELLKNRFFSESIKQQALMQFSLMHNPTKASFEAVKEFSKSESRELSSTSILALGKIIENWNENEPTGVDDSFLDESIAYIHENYLNATTEIDKSIALSALGNSGLPENKIIIEEALNDSNDMLRSKAVRALRKDFDDNATQIILNSAKFDTSPKVRKTALETLKTRPSNVDISDVVNTILLDEKNEDVRISALHTAAYVNSNKDELLHLLDNILSDGADGKFMLEALKLQEYLRDS